MKTFLSCLFLLLSLAGKTNTAPIYKRQDIIVEGGNPFKDALATWLAPVPGAPVHSPSDSQAGAANVPIATSGAAKGSAQSNEAQQNSQTEGRQAAGTQPADQTQSSTPNQQTAGQNAPVAGQTTTLLNQNTAVVNNSPSNTAIANPGQASPEAKAPSPTDRDGSQPPSSTNAVYVQTITNAQGVAVVATVTAPIVYVSQGGSFVRVTKTAEAGQLNSDQQQNLKSKISDFIFDPDTTINVSPGGGGGNSNNPNSLKPKPDPTDPDGVYPGVYGPNDITVTWVQIALPQGQDPKTAGLQMLIAESKWNA